MTERKRLMFSEDAEQAVLSAMLMSPDAVLSAADVLTEEMFAADANREVFRAMTCLADQRMSVDPLTLTEELTKRGALDTIGGKEYLSYLVDAVPTAANVAYHARLVREYHARRRIQTLGLEIAEKAAKGDASPESLELEIRESLDALRTSETDGRRYDDIHQQADGVIDFLSQDEEPGLRFGFHQIDRAIVPILPGQLVEIGAASGAGKSTVARNFVAKWAGEMKQKTAFLSFEMTAQEQLLALGCMDTGIDAGDAITRNLSMDQRTALAKAVRWWERTDLLTINERGNVTPQSVLNAMERYVKAGHTLFVLDHLHRVDYGEAADERLLRTRIGSFAKRLKDFAKEHTVRVVALVQLMKMSPNDEPDQSNIRESAKIIEEADKILLVWRPLVACRRLYDGSVEPIEPTAGHRIFRDSDELPEGAVWGPDDTRIYFKSGKQRWRPKGGFFIVRFNPASTLMYDADRAEPRLSAA